MQVEEILEKKKFSLLLKRCFDFLVSGIAIVALIPLFIIVGILIKTGSKGSVLFKQIRVGKNGEEFKILKFRTMVVDAEKLGMQITVGQDKRITKVGKILRKTKLDELPQLGNVFLGDMSFVGPRPEVPKYVNMYTEEQKKVLLVRPGITDLASIEFRNENDILANSENPEKTYIKEIMPKKLELNFEYIKNVSVISDIKIIINTLIKIF